MIQRIQTIYFILALVAVSVFFVPAIATIGETLEVTATNITLNGEVMTTAHLPIWLFVGLPVLAMLFIAISTFLYNKRPLQMKLTGASMLLTAVWAVLSFMQIDKIRLHEMPEANVSYSLGAYLPVATIAFLILAYRGIKKDEDLVKSIDRLR